MGRFDGAWEEKGVNGPRVEIKDNTLVRLWMASPVLETSFEIVEEGGKVVLKLEHSGLRDSGSVDAYATIKECYYDGAALVMVDEYRFAGETTLRLFPTTNSRYGNVSIINDEILPLLQGRWESKYTDLEFDGGVLSIFGHALSKPETVTQIVVAKPNGYDNGEVKILDKDPSNHSIGSFDYMRYGDGVLKAYVTVCDAQPMEVVFIKKN